VPVLLDAFRRVLVPSGLFDILFKDDSGRNDFAVLHPRLPVDDLLRPIEHQIGSPVSDRVIDQHAGTTRVDDLVKRAPGERNEGFDAERDVLQERLDRLGHGELRILSKDVAGVRFGGPPRAVIEIRAL
jgi:hypothetical protein